MSKDDELANGLLTVRDVANWMKVSASLVYQLVESGKLPVYRIGCGRGAIRFRTDDIEAYLESCRAAHVPQPPLRKVRPRLKHIRVN